MHGPGIDELSVWYEGTTTTAKTWLYQDQLGSVIGTANSAGTSTAIHSYGPYGEPNIATGIRFRYTGQQFIGSLNLYYYKARFYSPALGRFLQTDPIGTADDLNLYAYVGNNPINFSDPSGLIAAEASMLLGKVGSTSAGQFALGFIPGYDLYSASQNPNASMLDYGIGILGILPGAGKGAGIGIRAADNLVGAAAKSEVNVYRVFGGDARAQGFSWTTVDPRTVSNFRNGAGLPSGGASRATNTADFLIQGKVSSADIIKSRSALPLDGNAGGLPELIIDPKNVKLNDFSVLKP